MDVKHLLRSVVLCAIACCVTGFSVNLTLISVLWLLNLVLKLLQFVVGWSSYVLSLAIHYVLSKMYIYVSTQQKTCCPVLQLQEPGILPSRSKLMYVLFQIPFGLTLPTDKFRMASRLVSRWILLHQRFRGIVKQRVILLRYDRFLNKVSNLLASK